LDKHVELSRLCGAVKGFFESEGLSAKETFSKGKHRVEASFLGSGLFAAVEIQGSSNRIVVDFLPWGRNERTTRTMLLSSIITVFGGGVLVRQDLKRKESMENVENQFWAFLDRYILEQTG
jgi:hypothetical protein